MTMTRDPISAAWAKLTEEGSLPLADHGTDVAAVMEALLSSGWRSILERAAGRDLTRPEIETLLALTFLHDVGKTNRGFWRRQFEESAPIGHTSLALTLASIDAARAECDRLGAFGADPLLATLSHHGRPVLDAPTGSQDWVWAASGDYDPIHELRGLLDQVISVMSILHGSHYWHCDHARVTARGVHSIDNALGPQRLFRFTLASDRRMIDHNVASRTFVQKHPRSAFRAAPGTCRISVAGSSHRRA